MANKLLLIGKSGTGKSTSLRTLNEKETAIIKCVNKKLPFRKGDDKFKSLYLSTSQEIVNTIASIIAKAPHIKVIVLDDIFYNTAYENFRRVAEKGYTKYSEMAKSLFDIITLPDAVKREDLTFIYITHSETNPNTLETDVKTIGKMIDSQLGIAGLFTIVLESCIVDGEYKFLTHNIAGNSVVKTPIEMFEEGTEDYIPNDMKFVLDRIEEYY